MLGIDFLFVLGTGVLGGIIGLTILQWAMRRRTKSPQTQATDIHVIAERVQAVARLIGLEVSAKEIATAKKGLSWLPPAILSQARLAMIFQFEKQYSVDLSLIAADDVEVLATGKYRLHMPEIEGTLRLIDVTPYDIQDGRILGLLDVIQMNAATQKQLMDRAQDQAANLFVSNDRRYLAEARASIERQLKSLLALFDADVQFLWPTPHTQAQPQPSLSPLEIQPVQRQLPEPALSA